jgi:hypothetical protein
MRLIPSGVVCASLALLLTAGCNKRASTGTATVGDGGPGDVGGGSDAAVDVGPRDVAFERAQYVDGGPVGGRAFDDCTACDPVGSFNPTVEFCGENDSCSAMRSCFHVTPDIAMCDYSYRDATSCGNGLSSHADDCGCDGLTCAAGQTCIAVNDNTGTGRYNTCVDKPCASASECSGGLACTPGTFIRAPGHPQPRPAVGRCFRPACETDSECTDGDAGRCAIALHNTGTGGLEFAVRCVYRNVGAPPAGPDPGWCAGTTVRVVRRLPGGFDAGYHICPELAH